MLFLLDANVLIDAARDYYPFDMVPEFWDWLAHHGANGNIKIAIENYEEVCEATINWPNGSETPWSRRRYSCRKRLILMRCQLSFRMDTRPTSRTQTLSRWVATRS